jgi:hypothetical protein
MHAIDDTTKQEGSAWKKSSVAAAFDAGDFQFPRSGQKIDSDDVSFAQIM